MIEKGNKKIIRAWTFYDWANSVYPLVITTAIFPIFYVVKTTEIGTGPNHDLVSFFGFQVKNTVLLSFVFAASFLLVSILSPILSGIADYAGSKKRFLQFFCYLGALSCASLYFFNPLKLEWSMLSLFFASLGFWNSLVFYNAYLPEIAEPEDHDKISARGFSMGYIGATILLILCLLLLNAFGTFEAPLITAETCFLLTAIWWIGFSQITYRHLPNPHSKNKITKKLLGDGFRELKKVGKFILRTKRLKRFLVTFFMLSMGVQTVMLMATPFAQKEIFSPENSSGLIIAVLIIQIIAVIGAFAFSRTSALIGNIKTLGIALLIWGICCTYAYFFVYDELQFYILAAIVGFVMGGTQALSRSTYSKYLPETTDTASFFSFFDITEKIAIVFGMVVFALVEAFSGDMRLSILALISFFALALASLFFIPKNEQEGFSESASLKEESN